MPGITVRPRWHLPFAAPPALVVTAVRRNLCSVSPAATVGRRRRELPRLLVHV